MIVQQNMAVQIRLNRIRLVVEDGLEKNINDLFKVYKCLAKTGEKFKNSWVLALQFRLGVMLRNIFYAPIKKKIFIQTKNSGRLKKSIILETKGRREYIKNLNQSLKIFQKVSKEVTLKLLIISRSSKKNIT